MHRRVHPDQQGLALADGASEILSAQAGAHRDECADQDGEAARLHQQQDARQRCEHQRVEAALEKGQQLEL